MNEFDKEMKAEISRVMNIMRRIEDITNTDAEHDADYGAVVEKVNDLARTALWPKSTVQHSDENKS